MALQLQGHPTSLILASIECAYMGLVLKSNLGPLAAYQIYTVSQKRETLYSCPYLC